MLQTVVILLLVLILFSLNPKISEILGTFVSWVFLIGLFCLIIYAIIPFITVAFIDNRIMWSIAVLFGNYMLWIILVLLSEWKSSENGEFVLNKTIIIAACCVLLLPSLWLSWLAIQIADPGMHWGIEQVVLAVFAAMLVLSELSIPLGMLLEWDKDQSKL